MLGFSQGVPLLCCMHLDLSTPTADTVTWRDAVMTREYERMGMGSSDLKHRPWRISQCNDKYKYVLFPLPLFPPSSSLCLSHSLCSPLIQSCPYSLIANDCSPCRSRLCATYPKLLVVPSSISDDELSTAAKFRMSGRIPAIVWRCV